MTALHLPLKREYFEAIRSGEKRVEYRLATPYWRTRLEGREFSMVTLTLGYPHASDESRIIKRRWKGAKLERITHPHFGPNEVEVFAIDVSEEME